MILLAVQRFFPTMDSNNHRVLSSCEVSNPAPWTQPTVMMAFGVRG